MHRRLGGPRAALDTVMKRKSQFLSGIEPRFSNPARNPVIIDAEMVKGLKVKRIVE
jgi:hypothetical protein